MEYRIKFIEGLGYFSQVKRSPLRFWKKIGVHPGGAYGLYAGRDINYPLDTEREAVERCGNYDKWERVIKRTAKYTSVGFG